ncbi:putative allophanate hydrolase subunit 2 [Dinoroseobacter shibae DFL 12 = DSM 16493]|jgi:allophanate hydrolase|uniref:Putative allophanate hydrolase subunit 2 n=1 Tax=Dinoroseobacter shibae (strain DSM 16493 / NCIMB 14021 / DFL 12) TaxID=398580 RepID=A8LPR2_DINSH|nr:MULTISPECIES: biotin-dependent carboxyltransferase family protein [Dinoroseobacter]ABV93766.1 putative allophanate hydrolase subunit 2 [Dinoroseobacter shibae DFL 12 = DSM 16493]MDD9715134.1 biotin-dependent carboxyltransferase family protein [Dinoroseobacter sp. PD6]URF45218.1 biotin-dependent carboxyltransferase family protein [Dinoroseobacter shibae]URF49523.1 biotin-dependent carboxyltransferase family protein [Dinoroseobacter shibae]
MTARLEICAAGPGLTVQDAGFLGYIGQGLSRGGAADTRALAEGAALLRQSPDLAAIEMAGSGGTFRVTRDARLALTGAPMQATLDGAPLAWHACHAWPAGAELRIGAVQGGSYGYLHVGGGIDTPVELGSRSTHLTAGLGRALAAGDSLPLGRDPGGPVGQGLQVEDRFCGGEIRIIRSFQSDSFAPEDVTRLSETPFTRDPRGNRMGVRLAHAGDGFFARGGLTVLSEIVVPGDIQVTGEGAPYILGAESQTTGGYPRIATVIPCDLPRAMQAGPGAPIRLALVDRATALAAERAEAKLLQALPKQVRPLLRDPREMSDLLSYQLISGVTAGEEPSP